MRVDNVSRRKVLVVGGLASLGVPLAGFLWLPSAADGMNLLSYREMSTLAALGEVFFPEGNAVGIAWQEMDLEREVDRLLSETLSPRLVKPFRYLLRFVEYGTLAQTGKRFSSCSLATRERLIEDWGRPGSKLRHGGMSSLKSVLGMAYFNHPDVLNALGWRSMCAPKPGSV